MRYYRRRWDESRGDDHDSWGSSDWFFEVADDGTVVRQVEAYDAGAVRRYSTDHPQDEDGSLSEAPFDAAEWEPYRITAEEFAQAWAQR